MQKMQSRPMQAGTLIKHKGFLTEIIQEFKQNDIRTSVFLDPSLEQVEGAKATGTDRIELYTEAFAHQFSLGNKAAMTPYTACAQRALQLGSRFKCRTRLVT